MPRARLVIVGSGPGLDYQKTKASKVRSAGQNMDRETGYNVNLDCPEELPDRLIYLLANPDVAIRLGQNGLRRRQMNSTYSAFEARFTRMLYDFLEA